jgi:internalin A
MSQLSIYIKSRSICSIFALFGAIFGAKAALAQQDTSVRSNFTTFAEWCTNKDTIEPDLKHTVEMMLLTIERTTDCQIADRRLQKLTELNLDRLQIINIQPLASLTNLQRLSLYQNSIESLQPLSGMNKLKSLFVSENKIKELQPLSSPVLV